VGLGFSYAKDFLGPPGSGQLSPEPGKCKSENLLARTKLIAREPPHHAKVGSVEGLLLLL